MRIILQHPPLEEELQIINGYWERKYQSSPGMNRSNEFEKSGSWREVGDRVGMMKI